jgi:Fic family protein
VPPPVAEMTEALGRLETYLHADSPHPPLLRLALIHYQFEAIHPFIDGNGRIGRLLIVLLLCHWKLLPLPLLYLSAYFERRRDDYYAGLLAVSRRSAWAEWIRFFLHGVAEQATDAVARARRLQDLQAEWRARALAESQSPAPLRLIDLLFEQPVLTIPDAARRLGIAYNSASRAVARLVKLGILSQIGSGAYDKAYFAEGILRTVLEAKR